MWLVLLFLLLIAALAALLIISKTSENFWHGWRGWGWRGPGWRGRWGGPYVRNFDDFTIVESGCEKDCAETACKKICDSGDSTGCAACIRNCADVCAGR